MYPNIFPALFLWITLAIGIIDCKRARLQQQNQRWEEVSAFAVC
jgi:hypothetical protein